MRTSENKIVKKENESLNDNKNKEDIINSNNNNININSEKNFGKYYRNYWGNFKDEKYSRIWKYIRI